MTPVLLETIENKLKEWGVKRVALVEFGMRTLKFLKTSKAFLVAENRGEKLFFVYQSENDDCETFYLTLEKNFQRETELEWTVVDPEVWVWEQWQAYKDGHLIWFHDPEAVFGFESAEQYLCEFSAVEEL